MDRFLRLPSVRDCTGLSKPTLYRTCLKSSSRAHIPWARERSAGLNPKSQLGSNRELASHQKMPCPRRTRLSGLSRMMAPSTECPRKAPRKAGSKRLARIATTHSSLDKRPKQKTASAGAN